MGSSLLPLLLFLALNGGSPVGAPRVIGAVKDTAGNPLPGVQVVVERLNRSAATDANGRFIFTALRPGTYHLDAHLIGYAPAHAVVHVPEEGPDVIVNMVMRLSPLEIAGIHVTATPGAADPVTLTQATTELAGQALNRNLTPSVAQTLANNPGMTTRYAGPVASTPVIRGLSGERILVVQDGQRAGDLSSTSPDHGLSIDPLSASRIEVVRGPASLLYGNNALGGVVNVISNNIPTTVPSHTDGYVGAQGESVNPGGALSAGVTTPLGDRVGITLRGGGRRIEDVHIGGPGTLENTDARNLYGVLGLGYVTERLTGGIAYQVYGFEYGVASPDEHEGEETAGHDHAGVRLDGQRHVVEGRADVALHDRGLTNLRVDGSAQWYQHDEIEPTGEIGTTFRLQTQTAGGTLRTHFGELTGALGVSGLFRQYAPVGEEALTPAANSNSGGVFLFQELPLGRPLQEEEQEGGPRLQLGARFDAYRIQTKPDATQTFGPAQTRTFSTFSGSIGISAPLTSALSAAVTVARAFRAPTVEELFSNGFHAATASFERGSPQLDPETNTGFDAVLRLQTRRVHGQFSAYYNSVSDFIHALSVRDTVDALGDTVPLNQYGQQDARLRGVEGEIEAEVARQLVFGLMGDLVHGDFADDTPLPFMPAARLGVTVRYDNGRYSLSSSVRHAFAQNEVPAGEVSTGEYTLLNFSAGMNVIAAGLVHTLMLRIDNALDKEYREATSRIKRFAPNPGRNVALVYRVLF